MRATIADRTPGGNGATVVASNWRSVWHRTADQRFLLASYDRTLRTRSSRQSERRPGIPVVGGTRRGGCLFFADRNRSCAGNRSPPRSLSSRTGSIRTRAGGNFGGAGGLPMGKRAPPFIFIRYDRRCQALSPVERAKRARGARCSPRVRGDVADGTTSQLSTGLQTFRLGRDALWSYRADVRYIARGPGGRLLCWCGSPSPLLFGCCQRRLAHSRKNALRC